MSPGAPGCVERQLTLTGTPEQISAANYLIQQRVAAEQVPRVRHIVLFRNRGTGSLRQSGITWMHSRAKRQWAEPAARPARAGAGGRRGLDGGGAGSVCFWNPISISISVSISVALHHRSAALESYTRLAN
jgi:hypothetical protein